MKTASVQSRRTVAPTPSSAERRDRGDEDRGGDRDKVMGADPLADSVLDHFFRPRPNAAVRPAEAAPATKAKPTHYRIVCISLYVEDIQRLEAMVADLKGRGHTKANKSQLIRAALDQVDLDRVPKGY